MNLRRFCCWGLVPLLLASLLAHAADYEDVQRIKARVGIPRWKTAALRLQTLRATPPDAATAAVWSQLDAQTDPLVGKAPLQLASSATEPALLLAHATWLRWRILAENADGRYSFAYAYNLGRMRNDTGDFDQEASIFYFHAKLALTIDGARCSDRSKADHLLHWYTLQDSLQGVVEKIARMPLQDKSIAILEAIALEEMRGERPPMAWLCARSGQGGDGDSSSRFISEAQWRKYRIDLLEQLTRNAMLGL